MQPLRWRTELARWAGAGIALLWSGSPLLSQSALPCEETQDRWLQGVRLIGPIELPELDDVFGPKVTVGVVDSLLWWYQAEPEGKRTLRRLTVRWFSLASGKLVRTEYLPVPELRIAVEEVRRILIGRPPAELVPTSAPERQQEWEEWRQQIQQWSEAKLRQQLATGFHGVEVNSFRHLLDFTPTAAAAVLHNPAASSLVVWRRTQRGWTLDTTLPLRGSIAGGIRFLDEHTLVAWSCTVIGRYEPFTALLLLRRTLQGWRIEGRVYPNPAGILFTTFQPRQLMDVAGSWVAIADAARYRVRLYPLHSPTDSAIVLERTPPTWREIPDTLYREFDYDPYNREVKTWMDQLRRHAYTASLIQSVMFLDSTTLGIRWYARTPLPRDSGTLLEKASQRGYVTVLDLWRYQPETGWTLLRSELCPPNPCKDCRFTPAQHPMLFSSYCDGQGNCFGLEEFAPGTAPEQHTYAELEQLREQHARHSSTVATGVILYRWRGAEAIPGQGGSMLPAPSTPGVQRHSEEPTTGWKAVTLEGDTLDVASLAPTVAVLFLSGYICAECIPGVMRYLRTRVQGERRVEWVCLSLASPSAVSQRSMLRVVRKYLDRRIRWRFAFDLCEQAIEPWMVQTPEQLPCRWWREFQLRRTPAAAVFRNGRLIEFRRFEDFKF